MIYQIIVAIVRCHSIDIGINQHNNVVICCHVSVPNWIQLLLASDFLVLLLNVSTLKAGLIGFVVPYG